MSRYRATGIEKKNDKNYFATTIYKEVPESDDDLYVISTEGDRCDNLAYKFYNNSNLWWFIARANNLKTNNIPAGISLRIPSDLTNAKGL